MRILVMGGEGMLGHKAVEILGQRFEMFATFRSPRGPETKHPPFARLDERYRINGVDALDFDTVSQAIRMVKPKVVLNCVGIVKQRDEARQAVPSIQINSLFPHLLADCCLANGARMIHISTDCVFSGTRGNYLESDTPDPVDLYGRSKLLGEVDRPGCLTLRSSIIGWELKHRVGLIEWFAAQRGRVVRGFCEAIYSGFCTSVFVEMIGEIIELHPDLAGLYQVASRPISKYDLLTRLRDALGWTDMEIQPDRAFHCNRCLCGARFEMATLWKAPDWNTMIHRLADEWPGYSKER